MIRVLNIIGSLERGGAETFLVNVYRNIDRSKLQFDFAIYNEPSEKSYYNEVKEMGAKVFFLPSKSKEPINNFIKVKSIVKDNKYAIVWRYTDGCFGAIDLLAAKSAGALETMLNSRSSNAEGMVQYLIHYIIRPFLPLFVTQNYACGKKAGKWMFGRRPFEVINNGINTEDFCYNEENRNRYRQEFVIQKKTVVGHVGRFHPVKNHKLIIDIYENFKEKKPESTLVLVGEGEILPNIKEYVKKKNLEDDVLFLGSRSDVPKILQMMDIYIMPSFYEGFPRALLEAQAAGLPCVVSSAISEEAAVTDDVSFIDINAPIETWVDILVEKCDLKKADNVELLRAKGYDIKDVAKKIEKTCLIV